MSRRGVSGWMFLLVPAHPGRPGQRAVKRSCVCVVLGMQWISGSGLPDIQPFFTIQHYPVPARYQKTVSSASVVGTHLPTIRNVVSGHLQSSLPHHFYAGHNHCSKCHNMRIDNISAAHYQVISMTANLSWQVANSER